MKASQVMTPDPSCCARSETAQKAAKLMRELDVGVIPVVDSESSDKLAGVITDRDVCTRVVAEGMSPENVKLEDCMTPNVIWCEGDDDIEHVLSLMQKYQIRRILVVDKEKRVIGVVSMSDLAAHLEIPDAVGKAIQEISMPSQWPS